MTDNEGFEHLWLVAFQTYYIVLTIIGCATTSLIFTQGLARRRFGEGIYPNPASSTITIKSNTNIKLVQVYNSLGKLMIEKKLSGVLENLDISCLDKGIFLIKMVDNNNKLSTDKLIKQ